MADENKTDKTATDKPSTKKAPVVKSASDSSAGKKESVAESAVEPAAKSAVKPAAKPVTTTENVAVTTKGITTKDALAAIEKAGASKDSDMKSAAKKISELDKKSADDTIKSKKNIDDLKIRAHEAKQRAQQKILDKAYVSDKPTDPLERLANTFDNSARRWEMVVYPSLFAFVLLAGYGFFLIYRLTHDIAILSQSVTHMAVIVSDSMPRMTKDLNTMTGSIDNMTGNIDGMTTEIVSMSDQMNTLTPLSNNIKSMTHNIGSMNQSVYGMQRDMHGMNRTVSSGPFGMMNDVMPFSSNTNVPPPMAPAPVWPAYEQPAQQNAYGNPYQQRRVAPGQRASVAAPNTSKNEVTVPGATPVSLKPAVTPTSADAVPGK